MTTGADAVVARRLARHALHPHGQDGGTGHPHLQLQRQRENRSLPDGASGDTNDRHCPGKREENTGSRRDPMPGISDLSVLHRGLVGKRSGNSREENRSADHLTGRLID